jgi:hypothetical protein
LVHDVVLRADTQHCDDFQCVTQHVEAKGMPRAGLLEDSETERLQEAMARHLLEDRLRLYLRHSLQHLLAFASWFPGTRPSAADVTATQRLAADAAVLATRLPCWPGVVSREHLLLASQLYSTTGTPPPNPLPRPPFGHVPQVMCQAFL